jgi:hypothetical protein
MAYGRPSRRRRGDGVGVVASLPAAGRGTREASSGLGRRTSCVPRSYSSAAARAARHAKMRARAAGVVLSEGSRGTSPAVRAWLLRGRREHAKG